MTGRRVLILGALSAIAEQAARWFAAEGARILLVGRHPDRLETAAADLGHRGAIDVQHVALERAAADPAIETGHLVAQLGGLDVALVAYGVLGEQARAEQDLAAAAIVMDTNFRSAALWCLALANVLERQRSGTLLVIGSVAGDRGRRSNYVHGAAKGGLGILVQGLAHRLARCGARAVLLIKPDLVDSPMTADFAKGALWSKPSDIGRIHPHRGQSRRSDRLCAELVAPRHGRRSSASGSETRRKTGARRAAARARTRSRIASWAASGTTRASARRPGAAWRAWWHPGGWSSPGRRAGSGSATARPRCSPGRAHSAADGRRSRTARLRNRS